MYMYPINTYIYIYHMYIYTPQSPQAARITAENQEKSENRTKPAVSKVPKACTHTDRGT